MRPIRYPSDKFPPGKVYSKVPPGLEKWDEGDEISCCSFCQMEDPKDYHLVCRDIGGIHEVFLCEVCYKTWAGCAANYPEQYEPVRLYEMISQCTNLTGSYCSG